jgi:uncharacterized membrane protein YkgB
VFGVVFLLGSRNKKIGILGASGSCATYPATVTIIPFFPDCAAPAGGFPTATLLFLVTNIVLLAASVYLLK